MKVKTHVKLAELAFNSNTHIIPQGFSKFAFNFGLVMVDNSWLVKTHPHYMQKSLEYIIEKIGKLLLIKKFNAYHSMQLGIVVHYLCDFCCNAHILGTVGNIPNHIKYERDLQRYLLENYDNLIEHFKKALGNRKFISHGLSSIKSSIENTLDNYIKGEASYLLDIKQCVELTSIVCSNIFNLSFDLAHNLKFRAKQIQT
nr:zinc dependent phospholipase C family protein [Clostridium chromiireducens]